MTMAVRKLDYVPRKDVIYSFALDVDTLFQVSSRYDNGGYEVSLRLFKHEVLI